MNRAEGGREGEGEGEAEAKAEGRRLRESVHGGGDPHPKHDR